MSAGAPPPRPPGPPAERSADVGAALGGAAIGLVAGALFSAGLWGARSGAGIGAALMLWRASQRRAAELRTAYLALERRVRVLEAAPQAAGAAPPAPEAAPAAPSRVEAPVAPPAPPEARPEPITVAPSAHHAPRPRQLTRVDRALVAARDWLFGGNTVVRVGVFVLLIGVTLLAKWAADHELFPMEARLAAAAAIGVALAAIGFRLRDARPGFATTLQGGGVAALYLVVFFAFRVYELLPAALAFVLFVAVAVACGTLALLQRSQPLIFIGSVGGFAAPVLASTGGGHHVALFSYYLLLDLGIAAVAWRESWRALNLLAFVSTYGVATLWGVLRYRPEDFATTEPFLIAFLALFTAVAIVGAWRRPPHLAGLVDGTLVFGTPLVTLLGQARLVEGRPLGMAISTACFGLYYAALATWVWRSGPPALRRMAEAFVALAVVFGTIALPLALDDALTTTLAWSLEGAGVYWVGSRQRRPLARHAGVALQALAALSFAWASVVTGHETRVAEFAVAANPRFLSCVAMMLSGFFIAREAWVRRDALPAREPRLVQGLAVWALLWGMGGVAAEIDQFARDAWRAIVALLAIAAAFPALELGAARLRWLPGRLLALAGLPVAFLAIPLSLEEQQHLFAEGGILAWPAVCAAVAFVVTRLEDAGVAWTPRAWAPALWLVALVAALGAGGFAETGLVLPGDWPPAAFGLALAAVALAAGFAGERGLGPFGRHPGVLRGAGVAPPVALGLLWVLVLNLAGRGDAAPLPYLPLANPVDLACAALVVAAGDAWLRSQRASPPALPPAWRAPLRPALGALLFFWGNGVIARSVHQWGDVAFAADALWGSTPFQASLSIAWTLVALAGMLACTRRGWRRGWLVASTLLGATVVKLFLVDLSTLSTGARIATFLVVGALLLVVGYLSPVPPAAEAAASERPQGGPTA